MSLRKARLSLYLMALFYAAAGLNHFLHPGFYLSIMPSWIGWHQFLVQLSGGLEILFALLLIPVATRRIAAAGIILLLIAVFPANVQMMQDYYSQHHPYRWLTLVRLPLQLLLIVWAAQFLSLPKKVKRHV